MRQASSASGEDLKNDQARLIEARDAGLRWSGRVSLRLLVVDEDSARRAEAVGAVDTSDWSVIEHDSAAEALAMLHADSPDLILVAAGLAQLSAADWVGAARRVTNVPLLVLSPNTDDRSIRTVIAAGANDVITPPYGAAVQQLLGTLLGSGILRQPDVAHLGVGPLELDVPAFRATCRGAVVPLALKEFELLQCLVTNQDRVVSVDEIADTLWGSATGRPSLGAVKTHVRKLRVKLGDATLIKTVHGQGYTVAHLSEPTALEN